MTRQERRLGKGLDALLGEFTEEDEEERAGADRQLPVSEIRPNPYQPRTDFEPDALSELVESIRENGLLQPLVVRPAEDGWEIVAGERRWRALRELGRERAPSIVRELDDDQMLVLALVENLQREGLSPVEEARGYQQLVESFGLTQQEVAERVGRDRSTVSNTLRLLKLEEEIQAMLADGRLTAGHARALLSLADPAARRRLAEEVVSDDLSVRATEERVRRRKEAGDDEGAGEDSREEESPGEDPVARRAEQVLERALGTQVKVTLRGRESGRIRISFHDSEEFERLCRLMAGADAEELFG